MPTIATVATGDTITETWGDSVANAINNFDAWVSYTPTLTNLTLGNGTRTGLYIQIGKMVFVQATFTLGSTSAVTGNPTFSLPVTAIASVSASSFAGYFSDASAVAVYPAITAVTSVTQIGLLAVLASGTYAAWVGASATVPFTWATSDTIHLSGFYVAA